MLKRLLAVMVAGAVVAAVSGSAALAQEKKKGDGIKKTSPAVTAMRARQKKCGAEWRTAKAAGKIEKGMKWPQYWSACNKRLKAAGG